MKWRYGQVIDSVKNISGYRCILFSQAESRTNGPNKYPTLLVSIGHGSVQCGSRQVQKE